MQGRQEPTMAVCQRVETFHCELLEEHIVIIAMVARASSFIAYNYLAFKACSEIVIMHAVARVSVACLSQLTATSRLRQSNDCNFQVFSSSARLFFFFFASCFWQPVVLASYRTKRSVLLCSANSEMLVRIFVSLLRSLQTPVYSPLYSYFVSMSMYKLLKIIVDGRYFAHFLSTSTDPV